MIQLWLVAIDMGVDDDYDSLSNIFSLTLSYCNENEEEQNNFDYRDEAARNENNEPAINEEQDDEKDEPRNQNEQVQDNVDYNLMPGYVFIYI